MLEKLARLLTRQVETLAHLRHVGTYIGTLAYWHVRTLLARWQAGTLVRDLENSVFNYGSRARRTLIT